MGPSFSISVPVGAWHDFLPANLTSLAVQKADLRVALLDASGDPRVAALADRYSDLISYRRHGPDTGQSDAIAEGWRNAPGDILGWLNADDSLMPGALETAARHFEDDPWLDMVYGHSTILDNAGRMIGYHWAVDPPGPHILEANIVSQPSCFFKRAAYEKIGGLDKSLHYVMDWDLWIRLYKAGASIGFIDAPLSQVLWDEDTKTASFNVLRRAELKRLIERYAPPETHRRIFRAFAVHTLSERIRPHPLRKAILRQLRRNAPVIYGIGADERIHDGAKLHLAHYTSAPKRGLTFSIEGPADAVTVSCDCGAYEVTRRSGQIDIDFARPFEAGRTLTASLNIATGANSYFLGCAWR